MKKTLGETCEFYAGTGFPNEYQGEKNGEYPFYKVGDISKTVQSGHIWLNQAENYISDDVVKIIKGKIVPEKTVVFAKIGEALKLNRRAITTCDSLIDNNTIGIKPDAKWFVTEYFFYYMRSLKMQNYAESTTVPSVRKSNLERIEVFIPSIEEQELIVKRLSSIENIINKQKIQINSLDELIKSRFVEMFGDISSGKYNYETRKLGEVANIGSSHRVFTTEFVESGIPFYRGTEIGELANGIKPKDPYYIAEEHYNRLANDETKPKIGDLLMPSICNKGQVWMVDTEEPFYYKDGRVLCISPDKSLFEGKYIEYFMKEKTLVEYPKLGSGSTFAEFKIFLLKDIEVVIPPLSSQKQFATFVKHIDKLKLFRGQ